MALRIALRDPERFAGVISLGGRIPQGGMSNLCQTTTSPDADALAMGTRQRSVHSGKPQIGLPHEMAIGADVEIRQYPDDDEMNTAVLGDIDDWIMRRIVAGSSWLDSQQWATSPVTYSSN